MTGEESARLAVLESKLSSVQAELAEIRADLKVLTAAFHKGKGALAVFLAVAGVAGALISAGITAVFGKG